MKQFFFLSALPVAMSLFATPAKGASRDVIAYEQTGVGGNRLVGYSLGMTQEVDEQQFTQLVPAAGRP